jgi:hypothetical protein
MGELGQNSQHKTSGTRHLKRIDRIGQPREKEETGRPEHDRTRQLGDRTTETEQLWQDSYDRTAGE